MATTEVAISISDVNDNVPQFELDIYSAEVYRDSPAGVPLTIDSYIDIQVSDADQVCFDGYYS